MPFLSTYIDVRTVNFFPPGESWLVNSNFPRTSRMQGRGTNSKTTHYLLSQLFFRLNTLKQSIKLQPAVNLLWLNTLSGTKTTFLAPERYDEQPHPFYLGVPTPPSGEYNHKRCLSGHTCDYSPGIPTLGLKTTSKVALSMSSLLALTSAGP